MLPMSSVAIIPYAKNARFARVPTALQCTAPYGFPAAKRCCYPRAVLFASLVAMALLAASLEPVDVVLDPGHSRADVGAAGGGLREYQLTLDLAQRVRDRLEAANLTVRLTREDT